MRYSKGEVAQHRALADAGAADGDEHAGRPAVPGGARRGPDRRHTRADQPRVQVAALRKVVATWGVDPSRRDRHAGGGVLSDRLHFVGRVVVRQGRQSLLVGLPPSSLVLGDGGLELSDGAQRGCPALGCVITGPRASRPPLLPQAWGGLTEATGRRSWSRSGHRTGRSRSRRTTCRTGPAPGRRTSRPR